MVSRIAIAVILLLLAVYGIREALPLLLGPSLTITSPIDNSTIEGDLVTISGIARHTETLILDGGPLLIDERGVFSRSLLLPKGGGILTLTAADRFGRTITERRTVFVP